MNKTILCFIFLLTSLNLAFCGQTQEEIKLRMIINKNKLQAVWLAQTKEAQKQKTYNEAYDEAWENNKPLVIWVNLQNKEVENSLTDCVHIKVDKYKDVSVSGIVIGIRKDNKFIRYDLQSPNSIKYFLVSLEPPTIFNNLPIYNIPTVQSFVPAQNFPMQNFAIQSLPIQSQTFTPIRNFLPSRGSRNC